MSPSPARRTSSRKARPLNAPGRALPLTVGEYFTHLGWSGRLAAGPPRWPPDAFALAAGLLKRSDAYRHAVNQWCPSARWPDTVRKVGRAWRRLAVRDEPPPPQVRRWWNVVWRRREESVKSARIRDDADVYGALVGICAAADEACTGVGIPGARSDGEQPDDFEWAAFAQLMITARRRTLCKHVDASRIVVLPKLHTPQAGMTLRSLTHNLSLLDSTEVTPVWNWVPWQDFSSHGLNILLLPWPTRIGPQDFWPETHRLDTMPRKYGFFGCRMSGTKNLVDRAVAVCKQAKKRVGNIDLIVLPELAATSRQLGDIARRTRTMVIGGVSVPGSEHRFGRNEATIVAPGLGNAARQPKHHRWKLDAPQIRQYHLGGRLDPTMDWWEHIQLDKRLLTFTSVSPWLNFCVLICEDLARQDPVAELVRCVGPNLVLALLQDGPQLKPRWSARYATVLADDPGCSVLTLTSLGMAELCRPLGKPASRVVALWKDAIGGEPQELSLEQGAEAIVLAVTREKREEWSADGRSDRGSTYYLVLSGVHQVRPT